VRNKRIDLLYSSRNHEEINRKISGFYCYDYWRFIRFSGLYKKLETEIMKRKFGW
jgi:hypothetical protein